VRSGADDPRELLARLGLDAVRAGLAVASGGNLSARIGNLDEAWVTAAGSWLDRLDEREFVRVRLSDGVVLEGAPGARPSTEVALHLSTYRVRPDINAIIHLHPQVAVLLDAMDEDIRMITTDHLVYVGRVARTPFYAPGTAELAEAAAAAAADGTNCVLLAHHGCSVLGEDPLMAYRRAVNLEEAARLTYRALVLTGGRPGRSIEECPPFHVHGPAI
jgi:ribulose-5-phosphate 4-epimerase/fuculose-1-phosphate aldolase